MKQRVISILDQSVGDKTSTFTFRLANALAEQSFRVLVIDANPNAYLTGILSLTSELGLADCMRDEELLNQTIQAITENLSVMPAGDRLADYEQGETGGLQRAKKLKQLLELPIMEEQDFILLTASGQPGLLMITALFAANEVIAPTVGNFSSLQNTVQDIKVFKRFEQVIGKQTKLWLVIGEINSVDLVFEQIKNEVVAKFPSRVFKTILKKTDTHDKGGTEVLNHVSTDFTSLAEDVVLGRTY